VALDTNCFTKDHRLNSPSAFRKVFNHNKRSADSRFIVLASENGLAYSRLGIVIKKKKIPLASGRNFVKRVIRESFRQGKISQEGLDIVVIPQKSIEIQNRKMLRDSLDEHWRRVSR
jgi:ribonuclease P protein component